MLCIGSPADRLGILACHGIGWVDCDPEPHSTSGQLTIMYRYPAMADPDKAPRTLRSVLRHDDDGNRPRVPEVPLRVRLQLAREVANAVLFVHVAGLVHKDIRPENVLLFSPRRHSSDNTQDNGMGNAFLTGFGESR
ncbi:hypothetical protein RSAG8_13815, partial [Rhizoctonia solani AG-8 WAC10335]